MLNQFSIRSITFDGLNETTANRIIKMRPMPTNFVIFARPTEMNELFQNVRIDSSESNRDSILLFLFHPVGNKV